jgi:iron complex outermembrane receptor protein
MNYGTSLGKEKVSSMQLQVFKEDKQAELKMLQVIYLMRLMLLSKDAEAGTNINSLFGNINNNPNSTKYLV